jgi:transposase
MARDKSALIDEQWEKIAPLLEKADGRLLRQAAARQSAEATSAGMALKAPRRPRASPRRTFCASQGRATRTTRSAGAPDYEAGAKPEWQQGIGPAS